MKLCFYFSVLLTNFCFIALLQGQIGETPLLRYTPPMHAYRINRISTDKEDQISLTVSGDKTAKIWDLESGNLLRTLNMPVGEGQIGMLFSGALSPDGRLAVLGGNLKQTGQTQTIYVYDVSTGTVLKSLSDLPNVTTDIEFSADGRYVAAAFWTGGLRVWRCNDWSLVLEDKSYQAASYNAAFDGFGNLATVCEDGFVRLYDSTFQLIKKVDLGKEKSPFSLAFSNHSKLLAIGYYDSPTIQVLDAKTLNVLYEPKFNPAIERNGNNFCVVSFSRDDKYLVAGGFYALEGDLLLGFPIRVWQAAGKGDYKDYPAAKNVFMDIKALGNGQMIYAGAYPDWGLLEPGTGKISDYHSGERLNYAANERSHFRVSPEGIQVGATPYLGTAFYFDLSTRQLIPKELKQPGPTSSLKGTVLEDWAVNTEPKVNGKKITFLRKYEKCQSVDVDSSGQNFVLGTSWYLRMGNTSGASNWTSLTPASVVSVNIDPYNRVVVSGLEDGTICWNRVSDGKLIMSLFVYPDMQRWFLWTPSGYYDCSPGAEDLLGWQFNGVMDKGIKNYSLSKFRKNYYRPDVIDLILKTLDESEALKQAHAKRGIKGLSNNEVLKKLPPNIRILSPQHGSTISDALTIRYMVTAVDNEPITAIRATLNGRPVKVEYGAKSLDQVIEITIAVPKGKNQVALFAENRFGTSEPATVYVVGTKNLTNLAKPKLYILAIGLEKYQDKAILDVKNATNDVKGVISVLQKQKDVFYQDVIVNSLSGATATKEQITNGLNWLVQKTTSKDLAIVYFVGSTLLNQQGDFFYLTYDSDLANLEKSGLSHEFVRDELRRIAGKTLMFLDVCHAKPTHSFSPLLSPSAYFSGVINDLSAVENAVIVCASTTVGEHVVENETWSNSAFAKAVIEGFSKLGTVKGSKTITLNSFGNYLKERVATLTNGKQHPVTLLPINLTDFQLGLLK